METEIVRIEPYAVRRSTAAKLLDCSPTTIWKLCREGRLEVVKVGADDRILTESIRRFAATRKVAA